MSGYMGVYGYMGVACVRAATWAACVRLHEQPACAYMSSLRLHGQPACVRLHGQRAPTWAACVQLQPHKQGAYSHCRSSCVNEPQMVKLLYN